LVLEWCIDTVIMLADSGRVDLSQVELGAFKLLHLSTHKAVCGIADYRDRLALALGDALGHKGQLGGLKQMVCPIELGKTSRLKLGQARGYFDYFLDWAEQAYTA
jgi:hypothetical protein